MRIEYTDSLAEAVANEVYRCNQVRVIRYQHCGVKLVLVGVADKVSREVDI
jgi:hypothetical protein